MLYTPLKTYLSLDSVIKLKARVNLDGCKIYASFVCDYSKVTPSRYCLHLFTLILSDSGEDGGGDFERVMRYDLFCGREG